MGKNFPVILEKFEDRIAPAVLINPSTVTFQDVDGDEVTVKFSKKILTSQETLDEVLSLTPGDVSGEKLDGIDLSLLDLTAAQLNRLGVTIVAKQAGGGDGLVNVGAILGEGIDLGHVFVDGVLGKITAGNANAGTAGLLSLSVDSLGLSEGESTVDFSDITSVIVGNLNSFKVTHDINKAVLSVTGSDKAQLVQAKIGGSLIGGDDDYSGSISVNGRIGKIFVGGDLTGGNGMYSGSIVSGSIGSVVIDGNVTGGEGSEGYSGVVFSNGKISYATVQGDLVGGEGERSGMVHGHTGISSVKIGGDIIGGDGYASGRIETGRRIVQVAVEGDIVGGTADYAGSVMSMETVRSVLVGGNLEGADFRGSGSVFSEEGINRVVIHGDLQGGYGEGAGCVEAAGKIVSARVDGNMWGSVGDKSGSVLSFGGEIGSVTHKGDSKEGWGDDTGIFYPIVSAETDPWSGGSYPTGGLVVIAVIAVGGGDPHVFLLPHQTVTTSDSYWNEGDGWSVSGKGYLSPGETFWGITNVGTFLSPMTSPSEGMRLSDDPDLSNGISISFLSGTVQISSDFLDVQDAKKVSFDKRVTVFLPNGEILPSGEYTRDELASYLTVSGSPEESV